MLTTKHTEKLTGTVALSRAALVHLLERARHIVPVRFPKPILTCVHLAVREGLLRLQATDGELSLFTQMPADGTLPPNVIPLAELIRRSQSSGSTTLKCVTNDDGSGGQRLRVWVGGTLRLTRAGP